MKIALLVTSFDRPEALHLVLKSILSQTRVPDKVVVCDDGSSAETSELLKHWRELLPICHVWQPDDNFRAARIRNLGASVVDAEYFIWIDGDCLIPARFVERHLSLAKRGYVIAGGRHLLSDMVTESLVQKGDSFKEIFAHWKFYHLPFGLLRDVRSRAWKTVRTCNVSLYRDDFVAIGGFDESFVGWGREDSDFVVRLMHNGIRVRSGRLAVCVAHLHHAENCRNKLSANDARFKKSVDDPNHVIAKSSILVRS